MNPYELELSFTQVPHKHGFLVLQISRNSQFGPENPVGQTHLYESEVVIQRPLFLPFNLSFIIVNYLYKIYFDELTWL